MGVTSKKIKVLMIGTDKSTGGGMWTVANSYINNETYNESVSLKYVPTYKVGSIIVRASFALEAYIKIILQLLINKPQILHAHMAEKGSVYRKGIAIKIAKVFGCKIVVHMHGAEFQEWYEGLKTSKKHYVASILNEADKIIILGEYWKQFIGTIVSIEKIEVIYNAVEQKKYIYNPDGSTVLFLGAVGKRKGAYDLVNAFSEIKDRIPKNINLKFYGPDFEKRITDIIYNCSAKERIQYCGWLDTENRYRVFSDTICSVLPSYNEGLPMTILETMSSGIPNISTNIAAIPEVVTASNGFLIEPGDIDALKQALIQICSDRELRIEKSNFSYNDIKNNFGIDKNINAVLSLYRDLL